MIRKIVQIADIHIPNAENQRPYSQMIMSMLKQIYNDEIAGFNPEEVRVVICGDIFENKVRTTNEAKAMFHTLLNYLNEMCQTIIIAGNHDMLENNHDRMDSITPTFEIEGAYPNVHYLDKMLGYKSGYVEDDNVVWNLYSMFENFAPTNIEHSQYPDYRIIGLYHGDVAGASTDVGRVCSDGIDTKYFEECDCVMAGHIHRFQTIKKEGVPIVYSGSVFQHDAGENVTGHGYVVWDLETMSYELKEVYSEHRIFKFKIDDYTAFSEDVETLINL